MFKWIKSSWQNLSLTSKCIISAIIGFAIYIMTFDDILYYQISNYFRIVVTIFLAAIAALILSLFISASFALFAVGYYYLKKALK